MKQTKIESKFKENLLTLGQSQSVPPFPINGGCRTHHFIPQ